MGWTGLSWAELCLAALLLMELGYYYTVPLCSEPLLIRLVPPWCLAAFDLD